MVKIKSEKEIQIIREGGRILAGILREVENKSLPGVTTEELNRLAESLIFKYKGKPSFKGYLGFPATLCTSINEEVVHAVPSKRVLKEGDILSLDLGMEYGGFHSDMAVTIPIGKVSPEAQRLIRVTKKSLKRAIRNVKPGNTLGDIGNSVQRYVESQKMGVVRELCGHGIGRDLHEEPQILNYGKRHKGLELKKGMVICIEPMVTLGDWHIKENKDHIGFVTRDGSLSAHFEHTIAVLKNGPEVLTV